MRPSTPAPSTRVKVRWTRWAHRVAAAVTAVVLFDQAVFAGQFLAGSYASLQTHSDTAMLSSVCAAVSAFTALVDRLRGKGPWWPLLAWIGLSALIVMQMTIGYAGMIAVHVPLGVGTIAAAIALAVWTWRVAR